MNETTDRVGALEDRAAQTRERLAHTLDEIGERKGRLIQAARTVSKSPTSVVVAAVVGVAATAFLVQRLRERRRRSSFRGLREAPTRQEKGILAQELQSAALSLFKLFVQRMGARGIARLLGRTDGPVLAEGPLDVPLTADLSKYAARL
jgi:hypothetical protein